MGSSNPGTGLQQAFRWTQATGMVGLGFLPGDTSSIAGAVSGDGSIIVGVSGTRAFRWTQATGMVDISSSPDGLSHPGGILSADGRVIVGNSPGTAGGFIWTEETGWRSLRDSLSALGLDSLIAGWKGLAVSDVSADGSVVVGLGRNPQGQAEAWRAVLSGDHHWINPAGGSWDVASNWQPASVPDSTSAIVFDLDAAYTVTGAFAAQTSRARRSGARLIARSGTIDFADIGVDLTRTGIFTKPSLDVSGKATVKIVAGTARFVAGFIGKTATEDPATVSRLQVFNTGTILTGDRLFVGDCGPGEVFIAAGSLRLSNAFIGGSCKDGSGPGEIIAGNGGKLEVSEWLDLGVGAPGRLTIEEGGFVSGKLVTIGALAPEQDSEPQEASVVDVSGSGPGASSTLLADSVIDVGLRGPGELIVRDGAEVRAAVAMVLYGSDAFSGQVTVSGVDDDGSSAHVIVGGLLVGFPSESAGDPSVPFTTFAVDDGGSVTAEFLILSSGELTVDGVNTASGLRSRVIVAKECKVGFADNGQVVLQEGALLDCGSSLVAADGPGSGEFFVDGASKFVVRGVLTLGDDEAEGPSGTIVLDGGTLDAINANGGGGLGDLPFDVEVHKTGKIDGSGTIIGEVANAGVISSNVSITPGKRLLASTGTAPLAQAEQAGSGGTLVIEGAFTQETGGVLEIPVAGPDSAQQGHLAVEPVDGVEGLDGSATLGGTLRLTFQDGYAPRQGDRFNLIRAVSTQGSFETVEVEGLAPGFEFQVTVENGALALTALNDGVAVATEPEGPQLPAAFKLHQNYPNPFGRETTIDFALPEATRVRLAVYDVLGREVAVLADRPYPAGAHRVVFEGASLPSGVYVYRMQAGSFAQARTMVLVK
ncbi:MAG TPA: T9SS type A sorting domain-containing protein [Rhodothermales bacterium]|nr:T9SS type A sorting domain-containing protein [Rhodothermales bacterium]